MYDAVDVAAIPKDAQIVAGYVDGNWPTYEQVVADFPNAQHVSITVKGAPGARVADCETGDLSPQTAAGWAKAEIAAGRRPCIYYSRAAAAQVSAALQQNGVALADVDFWVADWTGSAHLIPGSVATQWADPPKSGGNFDISETAEGWPVSTPVPAPPSPAPAPAPSPQQEVNMDDGGVAVIEHTNPGGETQRHVFAVINGELIHSWQSVVGPDFSWTSERIPLPS